MTFGKPKDSFFGKPYDYHEALDIFSSEKFKASQKEYAAYRENLQKSMCGFEGRLYQQRIEDFQDSSICNRTHELSGFHFHTEDHSFTTIDFWSIVIRAASHYNVHIGDPTKVAPFPYLCIPTEDNEGVYITTAAYGTAYIVSFRLHDHCGIVVKIEKAYRWYDGGGNSTTFGSSSSLFGGSVLYDLLCRFWVPEDQNARSFINSLNNYPTSLRRRNLVRPSIEDGMVTGTLALSQYLEEYDKVCPCCFHNDQETRGYDSRLRCHCAPDGVLVVAACCILGKRSFELYNHTCKYKYISGSTANANYGYTRVIHDAGCWLRGLIAHLQDFRTQEDGSDDESSSDDY